jgi:parallel beta-helix repeat protein
VKMYTKKVGIELFSVVIVAICALVLTSGVVSAADIFVGPSETYTTIQSAVTAANPFDTIIVRDGTYTENIDVTVDNVTIRSENGSANCFVNASDQNDHVFSVTADWVNISGFTVQGATGTYKAGIYLNNVDHCTISENTASYNNYGIFLGYSSNNNLTGNTASNNYDGIYLYTLSNNNNLTGNTANSNEWHGIVLESSGTNNLTGNIANSNIYGGIFLYSSSTNTLTGNIANSNIYGGIFLEYSSSNFIYNNYFNNTQNAWDSGNNVWNVTKTAGTNIIGGSWLGGNYWSDYAGMDTDGDGLGNTKVPYNSSGDIQNGGDYLPLTSVGEAPKPVHNLITGENFSTIQAAIDASNTTIGHIIEVDPGTYTENVNVNKQLTIRSTSGNPADTIVQAANSEDHVFEVTVNWVNISGFTVRDATGSGKAGIYLNVDHCTISENNASNTAFGIYLSSSSNNTLTGNTANSNIWGIYLYSSDTNTLTGNAANSNNYCGIFLEFSSSNFIYNNYFNNTQNAWDSGNNVWNIAKTEGRNIIDGDWLGGNFWSDYAGTDGDGDGLGDTPYDILGGANKDYLPLVAIAAPQIFDTGKGDYPSISGTHNGTITPFYDINISKMYTYPCAGTGGHAEYVKIWQGTETIVEESWNGYTGDWHNITFDEQFTLETGNTYNYTIRTGSYPQIHHTPELLTAKGWITCTSFEDANGNVHTDWIPAIRLY